MTAAPVTLVHIITKLELGGAQETALHIVGRADRRLFAPEILHGPGGLMDEEARALPGVGDVLVSHLVREIRPLSDIRAFLEIRRHLAALRRERPGPMIVHTHSSKAGILGRAAARAAGAEVIVHTIHGFPFHPGQSAPVRTLYVLLERLAARVTDAFVAVARADIEEGTRLGIFPAGKARLIRSGIVIGDFAAPRVPRAETRRALGIEGETPLVGMIACFKPQKAPADFVRVAALVARGAPEARFIVVGDGELRPEMEEAVSSLGMGGALRLLGWRRDVPDLLHAMDVLVLTSRWEGLPRVIPQAMAAGRPVVANAVDGVPEAVTDGVTGFLLRPGDIEGMAARILSLVRDPEARRRMGEEGRRRAAEFDADLMVRLQEELYREKAGPGARR